MTSRIDLPASFDDGAFARLVPFGDDRDLAVRRGDRMNEISYGAARRSTSRSRPGCFSDAEVTKILLSISVIGDRLARPIRVIRRVLHAAAAMG